MTPAVQRWAALVVGGLLIAAVLQDAFEVMLLPRRVARRLRLVRLYFQSTWRFWRFAARAWRQGSGRERFLSIFGPLSMMSLFAIWATTLIYGFGLLHWWAEGGTGRLSRQVYMSGVTFFTLGYGDVVPRTGLGRLLAVIEAGVGFGLMAVVIGYLPVLYQLFSRREAHVLQLDSRAGSPPTASEMLTRHQESAALDKIDDLLRAWELWAADLLESHLSYPMLAYYRSQHADQSWLAAIAAVMDTCALILVGIEDVRPLQARMTFAMGRQVVIEMARSLEVVSVRAEDVRPRLDPEAFEAMLKAFEAAGLHWNGGAESLELLGVIAATYEPLLQGLAGHLMIPLPDWMPKEGSADHWERGPRGIIARRLISGLADGSLGPGELRRTRRHGGRRRRVPPPSE